MDTVIEAFHHNLYETTYCLAYFEYHSQEIAFNVANIDNHHTINELCICNRDSTLCDYYYENIFIGTNLFPSNITQDIWTLLQGCPLQVKPFQRNRDLHVNCSCSFKMIVEHWVLW